MNASVLAAGVPSAAYLSLLLADGRLPTGAHTQSASRTCADVPA